MAEAQGIEVRREGRIAIVEIDRPAVNALSFSAYDSLRKVFDDLSADLSVSVAVLTGAGERAFCAGHDVREFVGLTPETAELELPRVRAAFDALQGCEVPVIAAINGAAIGAGLALASLSDIRLASTNAVFALPEIDVGVLGSASHLMRLVPQGLARLLALTGRRLDAEAAQRVGLVEEIHAPEDLRAAALELAREIAAKSPPALRLAKRTYNRLEELPVSAGYELECAMTALLRRGPDAAEGASAFVHKRDAEYDFSGTPKRTEPCRSTAGE